MNINTVSNYLSNSAESVKRFGGDVLRAFQENVQRTPYGTYSSAFGTQYEVATNVGPAAQRVAQAAAETVTDKTRRQAWFYQNPWRLASSVGQYAGPRLGVGSAAGAVAAFGIPALMHTMSGTAGPISQGLRPKGYKSVAPASKEVDPSGRTPQSVPLEFGLRYFAGQRSQLLPYQDFKQERPDVAPSTYVQYRRYLSKKPEAGQLIEINPEEQSFTTVGGLVRGTARGLNDPEIRIKGVPITLSSAVGTAAGLGTIKAASRFLDERQPYARPAVDLGVKKRGLEEELAKATSSEVRQELQKELAGVQQKIGEQVSKLKSAPVGTRLAAQLGEFRDPALLAAGAAAALGTAAITKKLFERAAEERIKKEDPVEYLKHKHGNFAGAAQALNQPGARTWQDLTPYVK